MKKIEIGQVATIKNSFLPQAILYWRDYDKDSVVLTYLDMKRRQIPMDGNLQNLIVEFSKSNNSTIEALSTEFLQKNGVKDYSEFFLKKEEPKTPEELAEYQKRREMLIANVEKKGNGTADMLIGGLIFSIGLVVTLVSLSSNGGGVIAYGAIIFGFIRFIRGVSNSI